MADGGIAGYADEDEAVGYADGGVVHMQAGGTPEAAIRAQGRAMGMSEQLIEIAIQRERMTAEKPNNQHQCSTYLHKLAPWLKTTWWLETPLRCSATPVMTYLKTLQPSGNCMATP